MIDMNLENIRCQWEEDKPKYCEFGKFAEETLVAACRTAGIPIVDTSRRVKDTANLLKKILLRGYSYEQMFDKIGVRIVPAFRQDVPRVVEEVKRKFTIIKKDCKQWSLGPERMGYTGVHLDVRHEEYHNMICEVQVRTVYQDAWANASHLIAYKPGRGLPDEIQRQVNLLSAVTEVADLHFDQIKTAIDCLPDAEPVRIALLLERHFLTLVGAKYDETLTFETIIHLLPALKELHGGPVAYINEFVDEHREDLTEVYRKHIDVNASPRYLFLFQPESIAIFALLVERPFQLRNLWQERYPDQMLANMAEIWGTPLYDTVM